MPNESIKTSVKITVSDAVESKCDNCINGRLSDNSPCPKCNCSEDR